MKTGHTPSRSNADYWQEVSIPWFTLADVWQLRDGRRVYCGETANRISELGLANSAAELLPPGTVVLSRTASVGFSGVMPVAMATSQDFWNWICGPDLFPEYLNYQFKAIAPALRAMNMGSTHQTIYQRDAASIEILVPPIETQRVIVEYLDRETARIDSLIEEQQRLVKKLRERRIAVVDQTLTRGLGSQYSSRSTGEHWLPTLPEGWTAVRTKRVLAFGPSNGVSPEAGEVGDLRTLSLAAITDGRVKMDATVTKYVDRAAVSNVDVLRLHSGDILIVRGNGNVRLVARAGLVGAEFDSAEYIYPDLLIRVRTNSSMLSEFFVRAFHTTATRAQIESQVRTAVGTFKVAAADVRNVVLPLPPVDEQRRIIAYLDEQTAKIDNLIAETECFVELSRERRSAVIAATVTGQIDVRAEVA